MRILKSFVAQCCTALLAVSAAGTAVCQAQNLQPYRDWFGSYGFTDSLGNIAIECRFDDAKPFSEGYAPVLSRGANLNGEGGVFGSVSMTLKWGYIDTTGIIVIPCQFGFADQFSEGYAAVMSGNKWGYIDYTGDTLVSFKYDEARRFVNGYAAVRRGSKWGYLDTEGKELVPCVYDEAGNFGSDGFAAVSNADSTGYVFRNGNLYATKDRALNWIRGIPFSVYAKDKVMNRVDEWQRREPGESVPDWEVRVNAETVMARIDGLEMRSEAEYLDANRFEDPVCNLGQYDTLDAVFPVRVVSADGREFLLNLKVPVEEAGDVADGWKRVKAGFRYFVSRDRASIAEAGFTLPGRKVYQWVNPAYEPDKGLILDYDTDDPDFTVPGKIYREMLRFEGDSSLVDVDAGVRGRKGRNPDSYAVIIANEHYLAGEDVPYALNDGKVFYDYCVRRLGIPENNIRMVLDATADDMSSVRLWLEKNSKVFNVDTKVIVYFAGRCVVDESSLEPVLSPVDHVPGAARNGLSLRRLYSMIMSSSADNALFLIDASYGEIGRDGMRTGIFERKTGLVDLRPEDRMVVFYGAGEDSGAYPYPQMRHGLFTYCLLKALQDNPEEISYGQLFDRVSSQVRSLSEELFGTMQEPEVYSSEWDGEAWRDFSL